MPHRSPVGNALPARALRTRVASVGWGVAVLIHLLAFVGQAMAETTGERVIQFDIPRQRADRALTAFAQQADITVIFRIDVVRQFEANSLVGNYSLSHAAEVLLLNSGLQAELDEQGHLAIIKTPTRGTTMKKIMGLASALAALFTATANGQEVDARLGKDDSVTLEEVVVTAAKRATTLQSTAISLSVLGREALEARSIVSAEDYLNTVPGVRFESFGLGSNQLTIRGLGLTIGQSPTAGVYLGDIPLTDATTASITDIKMVDMARVEVLRGPQGTLYGAGALGGAVRQIPVDPVMNEFESRIKVGYSHTDGSDDPGYSATAVMNATIKEDKLAIRLAGYHFKESGYVDMVRDARIAPMTATYQLPAVEEIDVAGPEYSGARVAALLQATDRLDVKLMVGYQRLYADHNNIVSLSSGRYEASALDSGREFAEETIKYANLLFDYDVDWGTLTSSTSWTTMASDSRVPLSRALPLPTNSTSGSDKDAFFQELRLATNLSGPFQTIVGGYYEDIDRPSATTLDWGSPNLALLPLIYGTTDPTILRYSEKNELSQLAFFGEPSYQLTDQVKLTAGVRWFDYERVGGSTSLFGTAPGAPPFASATGDLVTKESGSTYKAGVEFTPGKNTLLYATWSQGFRLGSTIDRTANNAVVRNVCDANSDGLIDGTSYPFANQYTLKSDQLDNYELGGKFTFLNGRANLNVAAFRIDWDSIPATVNASIDGFNCASTFNGGAARTEGLELDTALQVTASLQLSVSGGYLGTAEYRDNLAGLQGQRLPFAPKYNGTVGLQYSHRFGGRDGFVRADWSYIGESGTSLTAPDVVNTDAYTRLDMRAGLTFNKLSIEIYGRNLTNEDATIGIFNFDRGWRLEPLTVGLEAGFAF